MPRPSLPAFLTGRTRSLTVVLAPALAALLVYAWRLGTPALWLDEAATVNESRRSGTGLLAFLSERDAALGAYYAFMHIWTGVGDSEWWVRLPSVLAMTAAVALMADLARRWWGEIPAIGAGLLMAVSPLASRYAQEARPYAIAIALALLAIWVLDRAARREGRRWWILYAVTIGLLGLFHFIALLTLVAHPFLARRRLRPWLVSTAAGLVPPALLVVLAFGQRGRISWITAPGPMDLLKSYAEIAGGTAFLALLGALAIVGAVRSSRHLELLAWFALPPILLVLLGLLTPLFNARYLVVCAPALVLLAAACLRRANLWQAAAVFVLAAALAWPTLTAMRRPDGHGPDARAAAAVIARDCTPETAVREGVATLQTMPYYLGRTGCTVHWAKGQETNGAERLWIVRPAWVKEPPTVVGSTRARLVRVPGLELTLWTR